MTFKDLALPITGTPGDSDAIDAALALANEFGAHLSVLELVNLPVPSTTPWRGITDLAMTDVYSRFRAQAEINAHRLRTRLENAPISSEVRLVEAWLVEPAEMAVCQAHYVDLTIVAGMLGDTVEGAVAHAYFGGLLLQSGRPVLMVPPRCRVRLPAARVVVAWRPGRESARAIHDALPLLARAQQVDILVVEAGNGDKDKDAPQDGDIVRHLGRHGIDARLVSVATEGRAVSDRILAHARKTGAQLIVAGGYGHSRLREWALGGVTRELLLASPVPVLFSH